MIVEGAKQGEIFKQATNLQQNLQYALGHCHVEK